MTEDVTFGSGRFPALARTARIEGRTVHFNVKISGSMVEWNRVGALLVIEKMNESVEAAYSQPVAAGSSIKTDCGQPVDQVILVAKVGSSLKCTIRVDDVKVGTATVRVDNVDGAVKITMT